MTTENTVPTPEPEAPIRDFAVPSGDDELGLVTPNVGTRPSILPKPIEWSPPPSAVAGMANQEGEVEVTYYKHPMASCRIILKNGAACNFVNHIFATTDPVVIAELDKDYVPVWQLAKGVGLLDVRELTDPMVALRMKHYREFLQIQAEERARANNPQNNAGESDTTFRMHSANTQHAIDPAALMSAAASAAAPSGTGAAAFNLSPQAKAMMAGLHKPPSK